MFDEVVHDTLVEDLATEVSVDASKQYFRIAVKAGLDRAKFLKVRSRYCTLYNLIQSDSHANAHFSGGLFHTLRHCGRMCGALSAN